MVDRERELSVMEFRALREQVRQRILREIPEIEWTVASRAAHFALEEVLTPLGVKLSN
jgi:hypothetical protein